MATCAVTGTIVDHRQLPLEGCRIYAIPETSPATIITSSGTQALSVLPSWTMTEIDGIFSIDLVRNVNFNIIIKEIGFISTVRIPDQETVDLFTLSAVQPQGQTSTGGTDW